MRRTLSGLALGSVLALGLAALPDTGRAHGWGHRHHHHHHDGWWGPRVFVGIPPPYAWGWGGYYYPPPGYPYPFGAGEEPEVYIERPSPPAEGYWYYCESAEAYYPRVASCPEPWLKVPPVPE